MKFSLISLFVVPALFMGALAGPTADKRHVASACSIVDDLYTEIRQYTGAINATAKTITADSSAVDKSTAALDYQDAVTSITSAITSATAKIAKLSTKRPVLATHQDSSALAALVYNLVLELSGALNNIAATLGLSSLLGSLSPLLGALSQLLLALEQVVDQLLALVKQLLDSLLSDLAAGLAGLFL